MRLILTALILCIAIIQAQAADSQFVYDAGGKRDPFIPLIGITGSKTVASADLSLTSIKFQGIVLDKNSNMAAMVNGELYRIGDKIGKFVLKNVSSNSIIVNDGAKDFTLTLYEY